MKLTKEYLRKLIKEELEMEVADGGPEIFRDGLPPGVEIQLFKASPNSGTVFVNRQSGFPRRFELSYNIGIDRAGKKYVNATSVDDKVKDQELLTAIKQFLQNKLVNV